MCMSVSVWCACVVSCNGCVRVLCACVVCMDVVLCRMSVSYRVYVCVIVS